MAIPAIYQGAGTPDSGRTLTFELPDIDYAGAAVVFEILGHRAEFPGRPGPCSVVLPARDTASMPLGVHRARLWIKGDGGDAYVFATFAVRVTDIADETAASATIEAYSGGPAFDPSIITDALADVDAPAGDATQRTLRETLAALITALKGLGGAVAAAMVLSGCAPALAGTIPWEDVPPDTPVDTNAVAAAVDLSGYATTGYVARAVADAEPGDYPAVSNAAMRAVQVELDPTVPDWAKSAQPPAETDPVFVAVSNRFIVAEADPAWTAEKGGYATTGAVAQVAAGLAGKQDRLPYATNAIPQSAVSGLTGALNGKIDQNNGVAYGSFRVNNEYATFEFSDAAGDPVLVVNSHRLFLPTNRDGMFALVGDIPSTNGFIKAESDPTVPSWAKAAQPPSLAEHDPHVGLTNGTIYIHGQTITPAAGGRTDVAATNAVRYATGVLSLAITSGATLAADLTGWPDGDAVFCHLQAAGSYSAAPSLRLLGYGFWPTNSADVVFARSGSRVLASVLVED